MARVLRGAWAHRRAQRVAAAGRPQPAVRQRRHGALQALPARPADAAVPPGDQRAEVPAHPRHRGGRQDQPARHVLPDERQLLLRRLLQGRRHRARLGARHPAAGRRRLRLRRVGAVRQRAGRRRGGRRAVEEGRRPVRRPHRAAGQQGQLLVDGRAGARRAVQRDPHRPRPGVRQGRRLGRGRPLHGVLEPRLHAGRAVGGAQQGGLRRRRPAAEEEHRHGHGPRAGGVPAPGRGQPLRDRRGLPGSRAGRRDGRQALRPRARGRRAPARRRRPRAQRAHAPRRRRHTGQRGPRLRAAPAAAPRRPLDAAPRRRRAGGARAAHDLQGRDGAVVPRAGARLRPDLDDRDDRGGDLPGHPSRRYDDPGHRGPGDQGRPAAPPSPASAPSSCTTPSASRSTSRSRWPRSRASRSTARASAG